MGKHVPLMERDANTEIAQTCVVRTPTTTSKAHLNVSGHFGDAAMETWAVLSKTMLIIKTTKGMSIIVTRMERCVLNTVKIRIQMKRVRQTLVAG